MNAVDYSSFRTKNIIRQSSEKRLHLRSVLLSIHFTKEMKQVFCAQTQSSCRSSLSRILNATRCCWYTSKGNWWFYRSGHLSDNIWLPSTFRYVIDSTRWKVFLAKTASIGSTRLANHLGEGSSSELHIFKIDFSGAPFLCPLGGPFHSWIVVLVGRNHSIAIVPIISVYFGAVGLKGTGFSVWVVWITPTSVLLNFGGLA